MNLSLSSKSERLLPYFHEVVDEAYFKNVALVCAVNNVPGPVLPVDVLVGLLRRRPRRPGSRRSSSTTRRRRSSGAPGASTCRSAGRTAATTVATGNSFAAPHICGLVARILSKHPGLTPFEVKAVLAAIANNPQPAF